MSDDWSGGLLFTALRNKFGQTPQAIQNQQDANLFDALQQLDRNQQQQQQPPSAEQTFGVGNGSGETEEDSGPDYTAQAKTGKAFGDLLTHEHGLDPALVSTLSRDQKAALYRATVFKQGVQEAQARVEEHKAHIADYLAQAQDRMQRAGDAQSTGQFLQSALTAPDVMESRPAPVDESQPGWSVTAPQLEQTSRQPSIAERLQYAAQQTPGMSGAKLGRNFKDIASALQMMGGDAGTLPAPMFIEDPATGQRKIIYGKTMAGSGVNPDKVQKKTVNNQLLPLLDPVTKEPVENFGVHPDTGAVVDLRAKHVEKPPDDLDGGILKRTFADLVKHKAAGVKTVRLSENGNVESTSPWYGGKPIDDVMTSVQQAIGQLSGNVGAPAKAGAKGAAVPTVRTQAEYDALPKGAKYIGKDGKTVYQKP